MYLGVTGIQTMYRFMGLGDVTERVSTNRECGVGPSPDIGRVSKERSRAKGDEEEQPGGKSL